MATIRLDETELERLNRDIGRQQQNLREIITQVRSAVSGTDWRSEAATSFKDRWRLNERTLTELEDRLRDWAKKCSEHGRIAHETNKKFL